MLRALVLVCLVALPASAHDAVLTRTISIEGRADGSVGALIFFAVPKGMSASMIRVGLDTDWSGNLQVRERSRGLREWVEVGLRDISISEASDLVECTFDLTSDLQAELRDDSAFTVAVLYECVPLERQANALWRIEVGKRTPTQVRRAAMPEGAELSPLPAMESARAWREWSLILP